MTLLLKSVKIVDSKSPFHLQTKDILIKNDLITKIEDNINVEADKVITIKNLHVSSGWFDSSISFGEPGFEDRETLKNGLDTAMKSGFTDVALNPNTNPIIDNASLIQFISSKTQNHIVDVFPIGALTERSEGKHIAELFDMHKNGAVAFGDYKSSIKDANLLKIALQYSKTFEGLVQIFSINNDLSKESQIHEGALSTSLGLKSLPRIAESIQLKRDLELIKYTESKAHINCISTAESVKLIEEAKNEGLDISCSVALSNLYFTDKVLESFDSKYKIWPPLREEFDRVALIKGVENGIIDLVTCDHLPLNVELKNVEFENAEFGSLGLESSFGALNKLFGLETSIKILTNGKSRFKIGNSSIDVGKMAKLSLFDPEIEYDFNEKHTSSKSKNSIFLNEKLKGKAIGIINNNNYYVEEF